MITSVHPCILNFPLSYFTYWYFHTNKFLCEFYLYFKLNNLCGFFKIQVLDISCEKKTTTNIVNNYISVKKSNESRLI